MAGTDEIRELANRALQVFEQWKGSRQALSRRNLCKMLDCDDRVLREAVRELRVRGYLIVADPTGGYRFARHGEEVYEYVSTLTSRIRSLREVTEAMNEAAQRQFGPRREQLSMFRS